MYVHDPEFELPPGSPTLCGAVLNCSLRLVTAAPAGLAHSNKLRILEQEH